MDFGAPEPQWRTAGGRPKCGSEHARVCSLNDTGHAMDRLTALLAQRPWLLADGATGSNLFERGLQSGDAPELWNYEHPDRVAPLQRAFVEAGADIILTNSFGGTRHRLKLHKAEHR